jgi:hypothetical protein
MASSTTTVPTADIKEFTTRTGAVAVTGWALYRMLRPLWGYSQRKQLSSTTTSIKGIIITL